LASFRQCPLPVTQAQLGSFRIGRRLPSRLAGPEFLYPRSSVFIGGPFLFFQQPKRLPNRRAEEAKPLCHLTRFVHTPYDEISI
jgi:hypothetical protein